MKIYFTNYANEKYYEQQNNLNNFAKQLSVFDFIVPYNDTFIKNTDFYLKNKHILDQERGGGYWLWKPFILLDLLNKIDHNDIIFYIDSADIISQGIDSFLKEYMADHDLMITSGLFRNDSYTTSKCFELMNCDDLKYKSYTQVEAGVLCVKNTEFSINFIKEWMLFCENENIITDINNNDIKNSSNFIDNRHDQSILTNLVVKYNIPTTHQIRNFTTCNVND
jgi:hypothetical protein